MKKEEFIDWIGIEPEFKGLAMVTLDGVIAEAIAEHEAKQWHKYPEEKPEREGSYLVTFTNGEIDIDIWKGSDKYEPHWEWYSAWDWKPESVIAFRELPEPFKP